MCLDCIKEIEEQKMAFIISKQILYKFKLNLGTSFRNIIFSKVSYVYICCLNVTESKQISKIVGLVCFSE